MDKYIITINKIKPNNHQTFYSNDNYMILILNGNWIYNDMFCDNNDLAYIKPHHKITLNSNNQNIQSITSISISKEGLHFYSDESCDLIDKFEFIPHSSTIVHGQNDSIMLIKNIIHRIENLDNDKILVGNSILANGLFSTFLILFLRTCIDSDYIHKSHQKKRLVIDDLFQYISHHLEEDLSLKKLEEVFFISGEHISREFKKNTNTSLHSYITKSRIDLSKNYLMSGLNVQEIYQRCGFGSYNHFFKAFKKETNMTPKEYLKQYKKNGQS